jgi:hypothetical protein
MEIHYRLMWLSCVVLLLVACGQSSAQPTVTPTPVPTATIQSGWKRFESKGVSIALPDTFIGGDFTGADRELITENLKKLGSDFEQMAETIKNNPELYLLFSIDTEPTESGVYTNLNVVHEKVFSAMDPATYMKAVKKQLPAQFEVQSQEEITLFGEPAGRMIVEMSMAGQNVKEVMYLLKRGDYMYLITFATSSSDFETKLPMFEQSLQTLIINSR